MGDWWALYDVGLDAIRTWDESYRHMWPGAPPAPDCFARRNRTTILTVLAF